MDSYQNFTPENVDAKRRYKIMCSTEIFYKVGLLTFIDAKYYLRLKMHYLLMTQGMLFKVKTKNKAMVLTTTLLSVKFFFSVPVSTTSFQFRPYSPYLLSGVAFE